ncbi:putative phage tail protein [Lysinibacillus xylanilyticus]|uniref:YmfQ family protein n=1 Tax=Lysinibacillus xylanilyticus TaxID=582475 RepID=A0ABT4EQK1_9BACI|nr:putative phage tail protein [Lysinibacillus xylanilyticus]MCY9546771.1 YmfQ family protein [Lysinibacillus xylanilyticus]
MKYDRKLIDYVPSYYDELLESSELLKVEDAEFMRLNASIDDLLLQFNASTATWGLREWERILAVSPKPNSSIESRRSQILAKLRGAAPATFVNMLAIINSHVPHKDATLTELPEPGVVIVNIPLQNGIALTELNTDIATYKPAHLQFDVTGTIEDLITLRSSEYAFDVPYLICGEFTTDDANGIGIGFSVSGKSDEYDFNVPYLICGEFEAQGVY